jgi:hypothetical protein
MTNAERERLRKLQDDWLKLPRVQRWIDRCIQDGRPNPKITEGGIPGPTVADVATLLIPSWEWYFANAVAEADE